MSKERRNCLWCVQPVGDARVYFGVVGPFCNVEHREEWLEANPTQADKERKKSEPKSEPVGTSREMRIGASLPLRLIRADYQIEGISKALDTGRACFTNKDGTCGLTDAQILAIAREEATLRGWSPPGVDYCDKPCETCKGKGKVQKYTLCSLCNQPKERHVGAADLLPDDPAELITHTFESRPDRGPFVACPTCQGDGFAPPYDAAKYDAQRRGEH